MNTETPSRIGRYRIIERIGRGGMAEIFLGETTGANGFRQQVVIKRLHPNLAELEDCRASLLDEARLVSLIRHENVVRIFGVEQTRDGVYLVLELVEGESLLRLAQRTAGTGTLTRELSAYICAEVCSGLHAAHETTDEEGRPLGIVHRDVTPSNVLITFDGGIRILDFGIAQAEGRRTKTAVGLLKGKFAYVSPERVKRGVSDRRSDVFALGVCLWELTTGRRLFKRENQMASLAAIVDNEVILPSVVDTKYPAELESIVMKALAYDPKDRYVSALDMRRDLIAYLRHQRFTDTPEVDLADLMGDLFTRRLMTRRAATRLPTPCTVEVQPAPESGINARPSIAIADDEVSFDEAATACDDEAVPEETGSLVFEASIADEASCLLDGTHCVDSAIDGLFGMTSPKQAAVEKVVEDSVSIEIDVSEIGDVNMPLVKRGIVLGIAAASALVFATAFVTAEPTRADKPVVIVTRHRPRTVEVQPIIVPPPAVIAAEVEAMAIVERLDEPEPEPVTLRPKRRVRRARRTTNTVTAPSPAPVSAPPPARPTPKVEKTRPTSKYERFD